MSHIDLTEVIAKKTCQICQTVEDQPVKWPVIEFNNT